MLLMLTLMYVPTVFEQSTYSEGNGKYDGDISAPQWTNDSQ